MSVGASSQEKMRMDSIEAARGLAAILVVLMHAANLMNVEHFSGHIGMGGVFDFGYVGVDFFFVLSGFIITYIHYGEIGSPSSIPRYLWRRFSRIYPIYWVILLLSIFVVTLGRYIMGKPAGIDFGLSDIPVDLLLLAGHEPKYVGVAWTLQYEVVFYLAFCFLLVNARLGAALFIAWGIFILANAMGLAGFELPINLGNAHCFQFLSGVVIGIYTRKVKINATHIWLIASLLVFIGTVVLEVYGPFGKHSSIGRVALGFSSAAILVTLVGLERKNALRTPSWLVRIGTASYSIYLGHVLLISITYMLLLKLGLYHRLPESVAYFSAVCSATVGTLLIGLYIEQPLVNTLKNRWRQGTLTASPLTARH